MSEWKDISLSDEPVTLGEVSRNLNQVRQDLKDMLHNINERFDRLSSRSVAAEVYTADKATQQVLMSTMRGEIEDLKKAENKRSSDRKWVVGVVFIPLIVAGLSLWIALYQR